MDLTRWGGGVLACQTHIPTVKVLWALSLVPVCFVMLMFPAALKSELKTYRRKRRSAPCFHRLNIAALVICVPGWALAGVSLVVLKLASPDNQDSAIGSNPLPTFLLMATHLIQGFHVMVFQARKVFRTSPRARVTRFCPTPPTHTHTNTHTHTHE